MSESGNTWECSLCEYRNWARRYECRSCGGPPPRAQPVGNANGKAKGKAKGKGAPSKADADNASPQTPTTKKDKKAKFTWGDQLKEQAEKAHKEMAEEDDAMEEDSSEEEEEVNHAAWIEELKKAEASVRLASGKTQLKNLEDQRTKAVSRHAQLAEEIEHLEIVLRAKRMLQTNKAETIKRAVSEMRVLEKRLAVVESEQQQAAQDAELGAALQNALGTSQWEGCNLCLDLDHAQALAAMGLPDDGSERSESFLDARRGAMWDQMQSYSTPPSSPRQPPPSSPIACSLCTLPIAHSLCTLCPACGDDVHSDCLDQHFLQQHQISFECWNATQHRGIHLQLESHMPAANPAGPTRPAAAAAALKVKKAELGSQASSEPLAQGPEPVTPALPALTPQQRELIEAVVSAFEAEHSSQTTTERPEPKGSVRKGRSRSRSPRSNPAPVREPKGSGSARISVEVESVFELPKHHQERARRALRRPTPNCQLGTIAQHAKD